MASGSSGRGIPAVGDANTNPRHNNTDQNIVPTAEKHDASRHPLKVRALPAKHKVKKHHHKIRKQISPVVKSHDKPDVTSEELDEALITLAEMEDLMFEGVLPQ